MRSITASQLQRTGNGMFEKPLTRADIETMSEAELRTEVLIPLFREMGFRDVEHYHGGTGEQGKDIVMWMPDTIRRRITYGVVAKAGRVSGKAGGKGSAGEVAFQIDQCLGHEVHDLLTLRTYPIDRCIVVASGPIDKNARTSLESALVPRGYDRVVDFIPGDRLWELVEEHLPRRLVMGKLTKLHEVLRASDEHYDLVATAGDPTGIRIAVREKYPGAAQVAPLRVSGKFQFPPTRAGTKARRQLEEHFRTGKPVSVPKEFISEFEMPDLIKNVMGMGDIGMLHIGPTTTDVVVAATAEILDVTDERVELPGVEFRVLHAGTEEATLSNRHQELPWTLTIALAWKSRRMNTTFAFHLDGVNVKQALEGLRFQRALSRGKELRIRAANTGLTILGGPIPPGTFPAPNEGVFPLLEALVEIQLSTNTPIAFHVDRLARTEEQTILQLAEKIRTGKFKERGGKMEVTATRQGAEELLKQLPRIEERRFVVVADSQHPEILGQRIELGPVIIVVVGMYLEESDRRALEDALAANPDADAFPTALSAPDDQSFVLYYPRWLSPEERKEIEPMFGRGLEEIGERGNGEAAEQERTSR